MSPEDAGSVPAACQRKNSLYEAQGGEAGMHRAWQCGRLVVEHRPPSCPPPAALLFRGQRKSETQGREAGRGLGPSASRPLVC